MEEGKTRLTKDNLKYVREREVEHSLSVETVEYYYVLGKDTRCLCKRLTSREFIARDLRFIPRHFRLSLVTLVDEL